MAGARGENQDICGHIVLGTSTFPKPLSPSHHCVLAYNIVRKSLKSSAPYYEAPIRHESCQTTPGGAYGRSDPIVAPSFLVRRCPDAALLFASSRWLFHTG